jgi:MerR family transcriptional regulator, light-induced transcriptional regulator
MHTIKRAAELAGLPVTTVRAWERRYAVVAPRRTESGYRLYDESAIQALATMKALVATGWAPKQAAEETRRRVTASPSPAVVGDAPDASGAPPGSDAFVGAAAGLDATGLARLLDEAFARGSFESVVDGWLMPALRAVGEAWACGDVSVAGEHMVSYAVQRRLAAAYEAAAHRAGGPRVVVGLPPGARHELGLLAFAVTARRAGLSTVYVGADLPARDWAAAVATDRAVCAVLAVPTAEDLGALGRVVEGLRRDHPGLMIAVGGRMQDRAPAHCVPLGHDLSGAATRLAAALVPATDE